MIAVDLIQGQRNTDLALDQENAVGQGQEKDRIPGRDQDQEDHVQERGQGRVKGQGLGKNHVQDLGHASMNILPFVFFYIYRSVEYIYF